MKKQMISILLAMCMLMSFAPISFAVDQSDAVVSAITNYISNNSTSFKSSYNRKAWGCFAFCNYVWKGVFKTDYYSGNHTSVTSSTATSNIYDFLKQNNAKAGDILWCRNTSGTTHNIIVLTYDSQGVWIADGDGSGKLWHNNVKISYSDSIYSKYFGGGCFLTLYKIKDSLWNSVSGNSNNSESKTPSAPSNTTTNEVALTASEVDGEWFVTIPLNYKLLLYSNATSTVSASYCSPLGESYRVACSKQATLSNGTIRYYARFNENDHYWFAYTSGMSVQNNVATRIHTIHFNANGGSVSINDKQVTAGGTYGDLPTPTRSDYTFDGWYTAASGGTKVTSSTTVNLSSDQITLYAHWIDPYRATLDPNGGTVQGSTSPIQVEYRANINFPTATRSGYTFDGWYAKEDGKKRENGGWINYGDEAYFYAHWTPIEAGSYVVTFDSLGGTQVNSIEVQKGGTYGKLPTSFGSAFGTTFLGWFTEPTGGTQVREGDPLVINADHILYPLFPAGNNRIPHQDRFAVTGGTVYFYHTGGSL